MFVFLWLCVMWSCQLVAFGGGGMLAMVCFPFVVKKPEKLYFLLSYHRWDKGHLITDDQSSQKTKSKIKHSEGVGKKNQGRLNLLDYVSTSMPSLFLVSFPSSPSCVVEESSAM